MTNYRLYPTNPAVTLAAYTGPIQTGIDFEVKAGNMWFEGYWWYVPAGGDTGAQEFVLFGITGSTTHVVISGTDVTSGTLTAGQWNFIPLSTPVQIGIGTQYKAATGWSAVHGFPANNNQFGAGQPFASGITNGPLFAWSDQGASAPVPYGMAQGSFGTGTAGSGAGDIKSNIPLGSSNSANFGMDVQVSDTAPGAYSGSYRLWPNNYGTNQQTVADAAVNYVLATEFHLSRPCSLNKIWYYSPAGTAQLATSCRIWSITGANSGTSVAANTSPTWSGAAASGWVSCSFTGVTLPAGSYKVSVYNGAVTPDGWGAKDASTDYWGTGGVAVSGITSGPMFAPGLSSASLAYKFFSGNPGFTPPYTDGATTEAGQATFVNGNGDLYPYLYVDGLGQNYWVDAEVTPIPASSTLLLASGIV